MDLYILGPTHTGKSNLANYIAGLLNLVVFNCDSIQVYKFLNHLTNKPYFINQIIRNSELVSITKLESINDNLYENIEFFCFLRQEDTFIKLQFSNLKMLLEEVLRKVQKQTNFNPQKGYVQNFLFDIKNPFDSYSSYDFSQDIKRISSKFNFTSKIVCGGTIYYAYNYFFNLHESNYIFFDKEILALYDHLSTEDLLNKIKTLDSNVINKIDKNNKITLKKILYLLENKYDLNRSYFKNKLIKNDFLIIFMFPKNREIYYQKLNQRINNKLNQKIFDEIDFLIQKFGIEIKQWLSNLSYEYKYFIEIFDLKNEKANGINTQRQIDFILQNLKYKEHNYAKRQITFMRRFIKNLCNYFSVDYSTNN